MKKIYQKPSVKIKEIETEGPLALSVGGNIGMEEGGDDEEPPTMGSAKGNSFFNSEDDGANSSNVWDK